MGLKYDFLDKFKLYSNEDLYYSYDEMISIIDFCYTKNIRLLGLEGFHIQGKFMVADIGAIVDFSSIKSCTSVEDCKPFFDSLSEPPQKMLWAIVLDLPSICQEEQT